jgi:hypothetical protein
MTNTEIAALRDKAHDINHASNMALIELMYIDGLMNYDKANDLLEHIRATQKEIMNHLMPLK